MAEPESLCAILQRMPPEAGDGVVEAAFRRGYQQGVSDALSARNVPANELRAWEESIAEWRKKNHRGAIELPPVAGTP